MGFMRLPGRLPANETQVQVPAFEVASKTEGYCGMCNVPGYVLWKEGQEKRREMQAATLASGSQATNSHFSPRQRIHSNARTARRGPGSAAARWRTTAPT